jgi:hypothetical protein
MSQSSSHKSSTDERKLEDGRMEVESRFRVYGTDGDRTRALIFDRHRESAIWVSLEGYESGLQEGVGKIRPGNVIQATVVGDPDGDRVWDIVGFEFVTDESLIFLGGVNEVPGPTDEIWERRTDKVGIDVLRDDSSGKVDMEIQVHPEEYEGDDIFELARKGLFPVEPWFDETPSMDEGAKHIIVVNPERRPYLAFLLFPESSADVYDEVRDQFREQIE